MNEATRKTQAPPSPAQASWSDFLTRALTNDWAVGSWDAESGILTIDPFSELNDFKACARPGCANPAARVRYCQGCVKAARKAGLSVDEYARIRPKNDPMEKRSTRGYMRCAVHDSSGTQCGWAQTVRGLCSSHYRSFSVRCRERGEERDDDALARYIARRELKTVYPPVKCSVLSCDRLLAGVTRSGLCAYHVSGFAAARRSDNSLTVERFVNSDRVLERHQLLLHTLPTSMRTEFLFVLQQYSARGYGRISVNKIRPFLADASHDDDDDLLACFRDHDHAERLKGIRTIGILLLEKAGRRFVASDWQHQDLIFLQDLPLRETHAHRNPDLTGVPLDVRQLTQPWLAAAFRAWLATTLEPRSTVQKCFAACVEASMVLRSKRSDAGRDETRLGYDDMAAITARFETRWSSKSGLSVQSNWWELCRIARRLGIWRQVPESFAQNYAAQKRIARRGRADQKVESDRVTPPAVISHLRAHTETLQIGRHSDMYRCVMELLMETGRRPGEIASLKVGCLIQDRHGGWLLRYTAHKSTGAPRELPVETPVVDSIRRWEAVREKLGIRADYLFPTGRRRLQDERIPHIGVPYLSDVLKKFTATLPPVPGPLTDADGNAIDFDLSNLEPYDFRRAYAQRHADNGTEPDALRQLMDHASLSTTMVYYQVSSKRRRQAVSALAPLAQNRHGQQIGVGSGRVLLKITPVPYGDCAEPANVAAGGTACQLRYQCAGCGFFRPNPSHIPEIEKELLKLRSQLRIAESSDTATYLLEAQRGLIADYEKILKNMRARLEELPVELRREIETMSEVMRRARSASLAGKSIELREI